MTSKPSTPESDGPKTETTLTTRIRINIPGSRPIPPVVVRKAMGTSAPAGAATDGEPGVQPAAEPTPAPRAKPEPTRIQAAPEPSPAEGEGTPSNWFAPRKASAPAPGAAPGAAPGTRPGGTPGAGRGWRAASRR
ncbi:hypothetical protein [Streptomyces sp. NPDC006341]|uniref:hypothetical protein n=1 Tax=Streptomyces sp. NPDC006341 TaxID=3156756 RepID=UPI0033A7A6D6